MQRLLGIAGWLMMGLVGCIDSDPPQFGCFDRECQCILNEDCPQVEGNPLECIGFRCAPVDLCASGIYVGDELPSRRDEDGRFPPGALVRQVSGARAGVSPAAGNLELVQAGEPRIFEIDFYDSPLKPADQGLFVEMRMALGQNSQACTAVLSLWPTKTSQIKFCFGGGRIGLANPAGGSSSLVDEATLDLEAEHTYRIDFSPVLVPGEEDLGGPAFTISLSIDDEVVAQGLTLEDLPDPPNASDRAPLIGFGAEAAGSVSIDFVRWGCNRESGPCLPAIVDDDEICETERRQSGDCLGNAVANELCDELDNDCDGRVDEDFKQDFSNGRPIGFSDFGDTVYLDEACGLAGQCANAVVACSEDGLGLRCDVEGLTSPETCDGADNDCDGMADENYRFGFVSEDAFYLDPLHETRLPLDAECGTGACEGGVVVCQAGIAVCSSAGNQQPDEICGNAVDDDCDGQVDEGFDLDGDGFQNCVRCLSESCASPHDCVDTGPGAINVFPGAEETCNTRDDDCDGTSDEGLDLDGDGFTPCGGDCDDDPSDDREGVAGASDVHPDAEEVCDTIDNNCNDLVDDGFAFPQVDGRLLYAQRGNCGKCGNDCEVVAAANNTVGTCVEMLGDFRCNPTCLPGFRDVDGDLQAAEQFWNEEMGINGCECRIRNDDFCDNGDRGCGEICNGVDDDCDGQTDEAQDMALGACWPGDPAQRGVGICRDGARVCEDGAIAQRCVGAVLPEAGQETTCDGRDEDCDGLIDEGEALLGIDGVTRAGTACNTGLDGICAAGVQACAGGQMRCVALEDGAPEQCDGVDNDCDGTVDEDTDFDGDGAPRCRACRGGEAPNAEGFCVFDCNDIPGIGANFSPLINEVCTGQDNDCDGKFDEDFVLTDALGHPIDLNNQRVFSSDQVVYNQIDNCGACGVECSRPNGVTDCTRGTCELVRCQPGFFDDDGDPDNGCEQSDCRPDNVGQAVFDSIGSLCSKPMYADGSACGCTGILRCVRAGGVPAVECVVDENNPIEGQIVGPDECPVDRRNSVQPEQCDELDNDCDGRIDENFAVMEDPENCGRCGNRCDAATPFCSAGQCAQCDSVDQRGCNELGPAPICVAGLCVPCQNDAACAARPGARNRCDVPSGRCVE